MSNGKTATGWTTTKPEVVRWYTPPALQGQIVEVSYGCDGGIGWERREDRSCPMGDPERVTYRELGEVTERWDPANTEPFEGCDYTVE